MNEDVVKMLRGEMESRGRTWWWMRGRREVDSSMSTINVVNELVWHKRELLWVKERTSARASG